MKCQDCPLLKCYRCSWDCEEYDICCLADYKCQDFPDGVDSEYNGCTRTNKWILAQDKKDLELKHEMYDCDCWVEYMKEKDPETHKKYFVEQAEESIKDD